jgi:digalactosyldiacylglycerol synthase
VHGVRGTFLEIGDRKLVKSWIPKRQKITQSFAPDAKPTVYFIGKTLWSKGLGSLMELLKYAEESADLRLRRRYVRRWTWRGCC